MSLNQIANPASQLSIYAKTVSVPEIRDVIEVAFPTTAPPNIDSHCVRLGKLHVFFCRARFTPSTVDSMTFQVSPTKLPGFLFQSDDLKEMGILVRRGDQPQLSFTPVNTTAVGNPINPPDPSDGIAFFVDAVFNTNTMHIVEQKRQVAAPGGFVIKNSVIGQPYDVMFTLTALSA